MAFIVKDVDEYDGPFYIGPFATLEAAQAFADELPDLDTRNECLIIHLNDPNPHMEG